MDTPQTESMVSLISEFYVKGYSSHRLISVKIGLESIGVRIQSIMRRSTEGGMTR
jgi:hypothetical protein